MMIFTVKNSGRTLCGTGDKGAGKVSGQPRFPLIDFSRRKESLAGMSFSHELIFEACKVSKRRGAYF
jgi:hypothetical protein